MPLFKIAQDFLTLYDELLMMGCHHSIIDIEITISKRTMITKNNFIEVLISDKFGFNLQNNILSRHYGDTDEGFDLKYNTLTGNFIYPEGVDADRNTTKDEHQQESYVVFLCIAQLFELGYQPGHMKLEGKNYSGTDKGYCDILVKDNDGNEYLIIECKTADVTAKDDEFRKCWQKTLKNGDQLFRYFNTYRKVKYLCLYACDYVEGRFSNIYHLITLIDNKEHLETLKGMRGFDDVRAVQGGYEEYFSVWKETYDWDYNTRGLLEKGIEPFNIGKKRYNLDDLCLIDEYSMQKKYNEFAVILRKYSISSHENAFDKLMNLFLAKVIDEKYNGNELAMLWKGAAYDNYFSLQDRLNILYRQGMKEFFNDDIAYVENAQIERAFEFLTSKADVAKETIKKYFRELKYYNNNPFAFLDVHNEQLFLFNAGILRDVILMLQDIYLTKNEENQFLGDLFEGFLNKGIHQSEGQFFTPMPIVRFLISSLPLKHLIETSVEIPKVMDYACGAGHFLTEYARQITPYVKELKNTDLKNYFRNIEGIEKDYRLSKVSQVAAFMYGMDGLRIHYGDGLSNIPGIKDHTFSVLVANPPYSVKGFLETLTEEERTGFSLSQSVGDMSKNSSIETFFVERAAQLLKSGGVAAIILPSSILDKGGIYMRCREIIMKKFDIVAIATFDSYTFGQTNTNTVTLFLRRKQLEPDVAEHYKNRIDEWFSGNFLDDLYYGDGQLLEQYIECIGIEREVYLSLLRGTLNADMQEVDIVKAYIETLDAKSEKGRTDVKGICEAAKDIRTDIRKRTKSNVFKKLPVEKQQEEIDKAILNFVREIEKEKLYYFMLAASNSQPVLIVNSPSDKEAQKKYLGYEWSNRKGDEGIKYRNVTASKSIADDEEKEDDTLQQVKGINGIQTPLFNPQDYSDPTKLNTLIRDSFLALDSDISEDIGKFAKRLDLVDMLDFSRVEFDKTFKTGKKKVVLHSKYPLIAMKYIFEHIESGARPQGGVGYFTEGILSLGGEHIDNTNGYLNLSSPKYVPVDFYKAQNKGVVHANDILICKDGALTGKVAFVRDELTSREAMVNEHVFVLRHKELSTQKYIFAFLYSEVGQSLLRSSITGAAQGGLNSTSLKNLKVPMPELSVQQQIVAECDKIDEEYNRMQLLVANSKIAIDSLILAAFDNSEHKRLETLCHSFEYGTSAKSSPTGEVAVIRMGNLQDGKIVWDDVVYSNNKEEIAKYTLYPNDVLFNRTNSPVHVGKSAIYVGDRPAIFAGYLIRVNYKKELINPKFLTYVLNSAPIREHGFSVMSKSVNQANISAGVLKQYMVPVPAMSKQMEIVKQIEKCEAEIARACAVMETCPARKQEILDNYLK